MEFQKIAWKFFLKSGGESITTENLFKVFNGWIAHSPEIFVDPADYFHVHGGVKLVLAGHYVNFYWDDSAGQPGLMYSRIKDFEEKKNHDRLKHSLKNALSRLLDFLNAKEFSKVSFESSRLLFSIRDKALARNDSASEQKILKELAPFLNESLSAHQTSRLRDDPRELFQMEITLNKAVDWKEVLGKLS